ncbi:EutP/PduV family microcompartment system protein [Acetobacterium carbinolicum]|jgi:ethanolamine utilization protein EutP|uniref:EutP/PduV family microcompartment system protein n=1 Tax=Acetobacterium TaxID=33951 RepID=UPI000DBEC525|nr:MULTISPECIES: EutP/PduV family microcompartment system protein [unclassified Acetobacterium]AWW26543.1 ethanolamine utilization protein EutP [Acetobacterium sp. KB-1]MDK2942331.1 ethanolamine utilization protein EutP [Acetobacterium sp.]MDZ5724733.1 EutP/PduV family microcompartment system protein [Acetobacterium sp. K1/6]
MANNRKRVALIGKIGSGKTTLMQRLNEEELKYSKTQMVSYYDDFIDTPGEFIELPFFSRQAINITMDAGLVILVCSCMDSQNAFPPNFIHTYNIPSIGVITKTDLPECNIKRSRNLLIYAGINPKHIYVVSAYSGEGIPELEATIHHYMEPHRNK